MADVRITFHIELAKQSAAVKKYIAEIKQELQGLGATVSTTQQKAAKAVDANTQALKKQADTVAQVDKRYLDQNGNMLKGAALRARQLKIEKELEQQLARARENAFRQASHHQSVYISRLDAAHDAKQKAMSVVTDMKAQRAQLRQMFDTSGQEARLREQMARFGLDDSRKPLQSQNIVTPAVAQSQSVIDRQYAQTVALEKQSMSRRRLQQSVITSNRLVQEETRHLKQLADAQAKAALEAEKLALKGGMIKQWWTSVKGAINYAIFLALGAALAYVTNEFLKFDAALREAAGLQKDVRENFNGIEDSIREMSRNGPKSAADLAAAFRDIVSSTQMAKDEQLRLLKVTQNVATAAFVPTKTAAEALITVMNAYNFGIEAANETSDILFQTMNLGKVTMQELADEMGKVTPIAASAGVTLQDLGSAMAFLTARGINAARAATGMARQISSMTDSADKGNQFVNRLLQGTGQAYSAQTLATKGLVGQYQALNLAMVNYIRQSQGLSKVSNIFDNQGNMLKEYQLLLERNNSLVQEGLALAEPDKENRTVIAAFVGGEEYQAFLQTQTEIQNAAGATKTAFEQAAQAYSNVGSTIRNNILTPFLDFAKTVAPVVVTGLALIAKSIGAVFSIASFLVKNMPVLIGALVILITATGTWGTVWNYVAVAAMRAWAAIFAPVTAVVAVIAGVVVAIGAIVRAFKSVGEGGEKTGSFLVDTWNLVQDGIKGVIIVIYTLGYAVASVVAGIIAYFEYVGRIWLTIATFLKDTWEYYTGDLGNFLGGIAEQIKKVWGAMIGALQRGWAKFSAWVAEKWNGMWDKFKGETTAIEVEVDFMAPQPGEAGFIGPLTEEMTNAFLPPNLLERLKAVKFKDIWQGWMEKLGFGKTPKEMWEELEKMMPDVKTKNEILAKFGLDVEMAEMGEFRPEDIAKIQQEVTNGVLQQVEMTQTVNDMVGDIFNAARSLQDAFIKSTEAMLNMGYSANEISGILAIIKSMQVDKMMVDLLTDMQQMVVNLQSQGRTTNWSQLGKINMALMSAQERYLSTAEIWLDEMFGMTTPFGTTSPEELAEIFAKQNYISQNVNQNVVIAPYIQIDGAQDEEAILATIDKALTEYAAANGFTTGR